MYCKTFSELVFHNLKQYLSSKGMSEVFLIG
jgi:hypothetical protein